MNAIEFDGVRRSYRRGTDVLAGVSFGVAAGRVVGLLGQNGAGKTTLIRIAMGMLEPREGSVRILGLDPRRRPVEVKRRIGYVAEEQIFPPYLTVGRALEIHRALFPTWDDDLARRLAGRFGLERGARIRTLSKGQARRVALLCAVAHRPEVLLLDEPASGLDPAARREFLETSIELLNDAGSAILFSSHYMTDVERMADRIVMLHGGRVLIDDDLDRLREGFSLAVVPRSAGVSAERLRALPVCLAVRERGDALRAVVRAAPDEAAARLSRDLETPAPSCRAIALEDLFVEVAGGGA